MLSKTSVPSANAALFQAGADDVFGRIASRYDLLCDLFSLGLHRLWKRRMARVIGMHPWSNLLDAAAGTGDVVLRVLRRQRPRSDQSVLVSDISPQMLDIARRRIHALSPNVDFQLLDAHSLRGITDSSQDLYSISLGLKICERDQVLREALRVLKPGGRLVVLEASSIRPAWLHKAYLAYMSLCMPTIGWLATGGDASAYRYLLKGVRDFPTAAVLADEIEHAGFQDVSFERLTLGIVAIHVAHKPKEGELAGLNPST